jgi:uncharacterized protein DUF1569
MQNLFNHPVYIEMIDRLNNISEDSQGQWGKMNAGQMLAHCNAAFQIPLSDKKLPRMLLGRILGSFIKKKLYNDDPWKKNLPTSPDFIIKDQQNFHTAHQNLLDSVTRFYTAGPTGISQYPHPFFGNFTSEQWGMSMYKHLDHHLKQFGA